MFETAGGKPAVLFWTLACPGRSAARLRGALLSRGPYDTTRKWVPAQGCIVEETLRRVRDTSAYLIQPVASAEANSD